MAVVDADFLSHKPVQQVVHPQERRLVLLPVNREVVRFVGVALQIEQLDVVVLVDLLQRVRRIERGRRVVPDELEASIEDEGDHAALAQLRLGDRRYWLTEKHGAQQSAQIIPINGRYAHIIEEDGGTHRVHARLLGLGEQRREVATR